MAALITSSCQDLLSNRVAIHVRDDSITVSVRELDRECLKGVAFRHIIFDSVLELNCSKVTSADSLKLIVRKGSRQQVAQLGVPLRIAIVFVPS